MRYSVECGTGELTAERPLLRCGVLPHLTSKSTGRVFLHIKFSYLSILGFEQLSGSAELYTAGLK